MPRHHPQIPDTSGATAQDILDLAATNNVRFLRLQFTDILGINKNVEIPASQFEKALAGDIMFDGSSIEGFVRIEESDMLLAPDFSTFQIFPWGDEKSRVARLICDINTPDGNPFAGDPRGVLKKLIARAAKLGYTMNAGMEAEFFMLKPIFGQNGSGMHTHQSLFRGKENAFWDEKAEWELSRTALHYIGGLLRHARGFSAITNPLVNSYKRLVPGFEAPVNVAWSMRNRSPMIRIPDRRGSGTRIELRIPDPAANPYLALAVQLAAGLDGIATKADAREPVNTNIWEMSHREKRRLRIDDVPHNLGEACNELEKDDVITEALGEHITTQFLAAKRLEWQEYITQVSQWELDNYLGKY